MLIGKDKQRGFTEKKGRENWARDDSVSACKCGIRFTKIKRRHHCRSCGGVFCDNCSNYQALVPTGEGGTQGGTKRVCLPCYNVLKLTVTTVGDNGSTDLQFVKVAIGKIRQEDTVQLGRLTDRTEVLSAGLSKLLDEIRETQEKISDGASLFTGTTHDIITDELGDLASAYQRREQRASELKSAMRYHTLTAFFTTIQSRMLDVLLHFVLAATLNETTSVCQVTILTTDYRISCRNLLTHFLRQCGEGASVRDLCEVMQDVAEDAALRITFRYQEQIACLTIESAKTFGECIVGRIATFFKKDVVSTVQSRMPPADLLVDAVDECTNCASDTSVPLDTRDCERDYDWTDIELLSSAAIKTASGDHWNKAENADPHKYYYMIGTSVEAKKKGYTPTGSNRNCAYPVFNLERAREELRQMIQSRGMILNSYYLSGLVENEEEVPSHGMSETEEAASVILSIGKIADLLRDPSSYGQQLLAGAEAARVRLDDISRKEKILIDHSQDLRDAPQVLSQQASYIRLQHELQERALDEFIVLMQKGAVLQLYSHLRLKLLQQLIAHRGYAMEAITTWPEFNVAGVQTPFSDQVLNAVDAVIAEDSTGVRGCVLLLDAKSHLVPRWLAERYQDILPRLTPEGVHVFSHCCLLRLMYCLPNAADEGSPVRALGHLGTGTLSVTTKQKRLNKEKAPLSADTCMQLAAVPLEQTLLAQRHVVLPTIDPDANWKESSLVTKCGIATLTEKVTGSGRHHKPQKYGYARGSAQEAGLLHLASPPVRNRPASKSRIGWGSPGRQSSQGRVEPSVSELYPRGCEVEAHSLQGDIALNGSFGVVQGIETTGPLEGRIQVRFGNHGDKALKSTNLRRQYRLEEFSVGQEVETRGGSSVLRGVVSSVENGAVAFRPEGAVNDTVAGPGELAIIHNVATTSAVTPERKEVKKDGRISWTKSTLVCTPRVVTAGAAVNCVFIIKDSHGVKIASGVTASDLEVFPFGHCGMRLEAAPHAANDDGATYQFTLHLSVVGTFPIGVGCMGKVKISNNVTVVAGPVDWLDRSRLTITPETTYAGEHMNGRVELRDALNNLATSAGLEDFTVSVTNLVELATTSLRQSEDGAFVFSFIPTEEGEVDVEVGFCGLLKQCAGFHECRPGATDFKNTLVVLDKCEAEVGDMATGVLVLRDIYGNRAINNRDEDTRLWMRAGDHESEITLIPVPGEVSEYSFEFKCTRRGIVLLETEAVKSKERVITKVTVAMPRAAVDWTRSTVSLVPREVIAGSTVTCTIVARDAYGNLLQELDSDGINLQIMSEPQPDFAFKHGPLVARGGTITCGFEPLVAGTVWAVAQMNEDTKQSNTVTVASGPLSWDASTVTVKAEALVGDSVAVHITARDKYGNPSPSAHFSDFQVAVWNEGNKVDNSKVQGDMGQFFFSFEPRSTGHAWAEVFYSGNSKESNRCVISPGRVSWNDCTVRLDRIRVRAGEVLRCDLTLCDKCGNETANDDFSPSDFLRTVVNPEGEVCKQATQDATPIDGVGAQFWFQFSPTVVGDVLARVALRGDNNDSEPATVVPEAVCWERSVLEFASADTLAGSTLRGQILAKDRFGNATEVLRYSGDDIHSSTVLKQSDMHVVCKNYAEADHEVLDVTLTPNPGYGVYAFTVLPKMQGEIRAYATLGDSVELTTHCVVRGGGIDWPSCSVTYNPSELSAGSEAVCTIDLRDKFGNSAGGAESHDFTTTVWNEQMDVRMSDVVTTGAATFAFTSVPTRAGQAYATVSFCETPKESNMVHIKPAELCFTNSTLDWAVLKVFAGDHLEGTLTFRDRFGNPTSALPPNEVELSVDNEGQSVRAFLIDDYVSAVETTQIRFYCEPTKKGGIAVSAVRKETGEAITSRTAVVHPAAIDWARSTTEIPALRSGEKQRVVQAGETVTGIITCRDRYSNLACPGSTSAFALTIKSNGQLVVAPTPYVPSSTAHQGAERKQIEETSVFHFDLIPKVAGPTEIESRYSPQPLEAAHKLSIEVRSGAIAWKDKCTVTVLEREVVAGEKLHFTIHIRDAHGNITGGAVASMFLSRIDNENNKAETSGVVKDKDAETFSFSAVPTRAGEARALVIHKGDAIHSPSVRVTPAPLHFPSCKLNLPEQSAAGGTVTGVLSLKDRFGNATTLGTHVTRDFFWKLVNVSTPTETNPKPVTKELSPTEPLHASGGRMGGGQATELALKFVPEMKGSLTVTCTSPKDETNHKFTKTIAIAGVCESSVGKKKFTKKKKKKKKTTGSPRRQEECPQSAHSGACRADCHSGDVGTRRERKPGMPFYSFFIFFCSAEGCLLSSSRRRMAGWRCLHGYYLHLPKHPTPFSGVHLFTKNTLYKNTPTTDPIRPSTVLLQRRERTRQPGTVCSETDPGRVHVCTPPPPPPLRGGHILY